MCLLEVTVPCLREAQLLAAIWGFRRKHCYFPPGIRERQDTSYPLTTAAPWWQLQGGKRAMCVVGGGEGSGDCICLYLHHPPLTTHCKGSP